MKMRGLAYSTLAPERRTASAQRDSAPSATGPVALSSRQSVLGSAISVPDMQSHQHPRDHGTVQAFMQDTFTYHSGSTGDNYIDLIHGICLATKLGATGHIP